MKATLESLRNAGIKIWMLTGDKTETATCIAISSKLVSRNQNITIISKGIMILINIKCLIRLKLFTLYIP